VGLHPKTLYKERKIKRRKMSKDKEILISIRKLIKDRSTYGYKRITALYNKLRQKSGAHAIPAYAGIHLIYTPLGFDRLFESTPSLESAPQQLLTPNPLSALS